MRKSLVRFLALVNTITMQVRIHGENIGVFFMLKNERFNHSGDDSLASTAITNIIIAIPITIFVIGCTIES